MAVNTTDLVVAVERAKTEMMKSSQLAGAAGSWDDAEFRLQCARDLDRMLVGIKQNGRSSATVRAVPPVRFSKSVYARLPHYFIDGHKLAKIGPSRDGGTYQHNVTREHYDEMASQLVKISRQAKSFETSEFIADLDMPRHEPLIFLSMLEDQKLLINVRRGRWVFANADDFEGDMKSIWDHLPRE